MTAAGQTLTAHVEPVVTSTPMSSKTDSAGQLAVPTAGRGIPPDSNCSDGQCVFYVTASADDAGDDPGLGACFYSVSNGNLYFGECISNGDPLTTGFIFRNIALPRYAQIAQAYIEYATDGPYSAQDIQELYYGEKSTNPAAFSLSNRPRNRVTDAALVNFGAPIPWHVRAGTVWDWDFLNRNIRTSPDLTPIVQAIVNQDSWSNPPNTNSISIIVQDSPADGGRQHRRVIGFDRDPDNSPRLVIRLKGTSAMPSFTTESTSTLRLVGSTQIYSPDMALRLTNAAYQSGSAWYLVAQRVTERFETVFDFRLSGKVGRGGDGFAFVLQYDFRGPYALGNGGCELGYGGLQNSIAIEFDTAANPPGCDYIGDPNGNHISVQTGLTSTNSAAITNSIALITPTVTLADGNWHTAKISYVYDRVGLTGTLKVYLDNIQPDAAPILTVPLVLSETLELDSGIVWAGFTSGSSGSYEIHDIMNSYLAPNYDLSCLDYDFTSSNALVLHANDFRQEIGSRAGVTKDGWRTVWNPRQLEPNKGKLIIQRGMTSNTSPLDALPRIKQVRFEYSWVSAPGQVSSTLPATSTVNALIELKYPGQHTSVTKLLSFAQEPRGEDGRLISHFDLDDVTGLTGLRLSLQLTDPDQVIYLKKVGLCFEGSAPRRPPVVPSGARDACTNLLANIQSRYQPFGVSAGTPTPSQAEFQLPSDVTLEPYPYYNLNVSGYPASLTYDGDLPDEAALVACTFKRNGEYYPDRTKPIVRFTAVGGTPEGREQLTLLNYAGYFSVGSPNWCYANDNVFTMTYDRSDGTKYGPGYNVPAPKYRCDTGAFVTNQYGPCATFVGSLYRAMGYFDVSAIANAYNIDASSTISVVSDLYHAVIPYVGRLKTNAYNPVSSLIVRTDPDASTYVTRAVSFAAIRAHSLYDPCEEFDSDNRFCLLGDHIYGDNINDPQTWGNDTKPLTVTLAPRGPQSPLYDPVGIWETIKAGDIAITVIERNDHGGEIPTHIQIVVGWGPRYKNGHETRQGAHLYPTYDDIPITDTYKYVPYVMDRYSLPGTGGTTGPRPFNYGLSSTATDFWVVDYTPSNSMQTFAESVEQIVPASAGSHRALTPSQVQSDPVMPLPLYVPGSVVWSPDGNRIALGNHYGIALYAPNLDHATPLTGATSTIAALAWSPDSTRLASAEAAQQVTIWNVASGNNLATLKGHSSQLTGVAWSPNGNQIASSSKDGTVRIWNANTFELSTTLPYTGSGYVNALAWSPSGDRLAASDVTAIYIWNMTTGQMVTSFNVEPGPSGSLTWTPDGQFLITPGAHRWDVTTGEVVSEYPGCSSGTDTFVALSPDGHQIAGIGTAATGPSACIDRLDDQYQQVDQIFLQTYEGIDTLGSIAWSPDSQQVVFNTQRGWLSLWNADAGEMLATVPRLTTTPEELEALVQECVADDTVMLQLSYKLLTGDYAGFIAAVQSQPAGTLDPACQQQLIKTAEFLTNNPLLSSPDPVAPRPLSLQYACSQNPSEWVWRVRNPNSYEVPVVWGWEDQWQTPGGFPFVVPAASNGIAGEWLITTPAQSGSRTLKILSGGFVATAQSRVFCNDIWLPVVLRGSP